MPIRLADRDARFWTDPTLEGRSGMGVTFDCPCVRCLGRSADDMQPPLRIGIAFANPIDGGEPYAVPGTLLWQCTGDTIDTLTLTPSIDASASGHWHGHVTNGELR